MEWKVDKGRLDGSTAWKIVHEKRAREERANVPEHNKPVFDRTTFVLWLVAVPVTYCRLPTEFATK